jgi:hypothetical protein
MVSRSSKTAKKQNLGTGFIMPDLVPRDTDVKYTGDEPLFASQPDDERRSGALTIAFNWYSRFFDRKVAKEQLALYIENLPSENKDALGIAKQLRRVDDKEIIPTYGWLARLTMRGLTLSESENQRISLEIDRLVKTLAKPELIEKAEETKSNRPNVQEIMREKARDAAGELEGTLDEFILAGAKTNGISINAVGTLTNHNVLPQHVSILSEVWRKKLNEFNDILAGEDSQLVEAYKHYSRHQLKAVVKFIEAVLAGLDSYINVKKVSRTPRKRKAVSPEKQTSKVKFLKTFEELKLTSVHPAKIIGATEVWAYDTAKRKLWYLVADNHVGTLGVKGATILGFDTTKSGVKTVRKPAEVLKKLMAAGKPAARKVFNEINAVQSQPNGRSNENLVILKVY